MVHFSPPLCATCASTVCLIRARLREPSASAGERDSVAIQRWKGSLAVRALTDDKDFSSILSESFGNGECHGGPRLADSWRTEQFEDLAFAKSALGFARATGAGLGPRSGIFGRQESV